MLASQALCFMEEGIRVGTASGAVLACEISLAPIKWVLCLWCTASIVRSDIAEPRQHSLHCSILRAAAASRKRCMAISDLRSSTKRRSASQNEVAAPFGTVCHRLLKRRVLVCFFGLRPQNQESVSRLWLSSLNRLPGSWPWQVKFDHKTAVAWRNAFSENRAFSHW